MTDRFGFRFRRRDESKRFLEPACVLFTACERQLGADICDPLACLFVEIDARDRTLAFVDGLERARSVDRPGDELAVGGREKGRECVELVNAILEAVGFERELGEVGLIVRLAFAQAVAALRPALGVVVELLRDGRRRGRSVRNSRGRERAFDLALAGVVPDSLEAVAAGLAVALVGGGVRSQREAPGGQGGEAREGADLPGAERAAAEGGEQGLEIAVTLGGDRAEADGERAFDPARDGG